MNHSTAKTHHGSPAQSAANPLRAGEINWTVLLWAIGVPIPLVIIVGLMRGCG